MSNDNYILQLNGINTIHPKPTVKNNTLGAMSERPLKEKSEPFTFSISQTLIDFSTLSPTNPINRSNNLTVSNGSANGYSIIAFEDRELSSSPTSNVASAKSDLASASSAFIPDTTCDNGLCSEVSSAAWTNPLTYGFGYRCDNLVGTDCASGFSELGFYKQFANNSLSETGQKVAIGSNNKSEKTVRITYKINVPGTQQFTFYSNTITYIAVPNF